MSERCCVCETAVADSTFGVGVQKVTQNGVSKFYESRSVMVPVCSPCKVQEVSKVRSGAKVSLIVWGILIGLGTFAGWGGAAFGFGLGFFITMGMSAFKKQSKVTQHPDVLEYTKSGYSVTYP